MHFLLNYLCIIPYTCHIATAIAFTNKRYIITCHGLEILPENIKKYKRILYQRVLQNALQITAASEYTKKLLMKNFDILDNKIVIINPGVETKIFNNKHINKKLAMGSISRFVQRKNFITIIEALQYLKEYYKIDFTYHIAGTGDEKNKILEALRRSTFKWKYWGNISDKEKITRFYPSIDVFILPTRYLKDSVEGFGIVYIEANSAGIPVIASPSGGVTDAVADNSTGLFCDPDDFKDIAHKTYIVIKEKERFRKNLPKWVMKFDNSIIAEKFNSLYSK